jgi:hypothetical protein
MRRSRRHFGGFYLRPVRFGGTSGGSGHIPRDWYFAATGNDTTGTGTQGAPYLTIAKALTLSLGPGDRILFKGGDTFSDALLTVPASSITIGSWSTGRAIISRTATEAIVVSGKTGVTIDNLDIRATTQIAFRSDNATASSNITVQNCLISSTGAGGLQVGALDSGWLIQGNTIQNCGNHGLVLQGGPTHEVALNTFSSNATGVSGGHDLYCHANGASWDQSILIHDNTFTTTAPGASISLRREFSRCYSNVITVSTGGHNGITYFDECPVPKAGGTTWIYNNLIKAVPSGGAGVYIGAANTSAGGTTTLTNFVIANNTVVGSGADAGYDFSAEGTAAGYVFPTRIVFKNNGVSGTFTTAFNGYPFADPANFTADYNGWWRSTGDIQAGTYFKWDKTLYRWVDFTALPEHAANFAHGRLTDSELAGSGYPATSSDWVDGGTTALDSFLTYGTAGSGALLTYAGTAPDIGARSTDQVFVLPVPTLQTAGAISPTGAAEAGAQITATHGSWVRVPSAYKYEWLRDGTTVVRDSGFVTASTDSYTLVSADAAHTITCRVTAQNAAGNSASATCTGSVVCAAASNITVVQRVTPAVSTATLTPARTIATPVVGNVMYAVIAVNTATDSTVSGVVLTGSTAAGGNAFVKVAEVNNAANVRLYIYRRVLVTGDAAGTAVTATQTVSRNWVMGVLELSGVDTTTPEDIVGAGGTGTSATGCSTGTTTGTTLSGVMLLGGNASRNGHVATEDTGETPGSGWNFNASASNATSGGAQLTLAMFDQVLLGTATNPVADCKLATSGGTPTSDAWAGLLISIKSTATTGGGGGGGGGGGSSTLVPGPPSQWGNVYTTGTDGAWRPSLTTYAATNPFGPPKLYYDNATTAVISGGRARNIARGTTVDTAGVKYKYYPRSLGFDVTDIDTTDAAHFKVTVAGGTWAPGDVVHLNDLVGTGSTNLKPKADGDWTVSSVSGSVLTFTVGYTPTAGVYDNRAGHRGYITKQVKQDNYKEVVVTETSIATAGDAVGPYFTADGSLSGARTPGADGYWVWTGGFCNNWIITGNSPGSLKIRIPGNLDVINASPEYAANGFSCDPQLLNPFNSCQWNNVTVDVQGMSSQATSGGVMAYSQLLSGFYFPQGESISYQGCSGIFDGVMNMGFAYDANKIGGNSAGLRWRHCFNFRNTQAGGGGHTDTYQVFYLDNSTLTADTPTWEWCFMQNGGNGQIFLNASGGGSGTKIIENCWALNCMSWRGNKFLDLASSSDVGARQCWINDDSRGDGTLAAVSPRPEPIDFGNGPPAHPYPTGNVIWPEPTDPMANIAVADDGTPSTTATHVQRPTIPSGATFTYIN